MTTVPDQAAWHRQRDALGDLAAFVHEHAPGSDRPLPLLRWRVGRSCMVDAEVHELDDGRRDPRAVVAAYADALGADVEEHPDENWVLVMVRGRIGPPEGSEGVRRTRIRISTKVPVAERQKVGGRAFIP